MTLSSPEQVLSTLQSDGSRRWLKPRVSRGRFLTLRRIVAYFLMALFFVLPWINLNGHPAIFLDIVRRRFHILGYTFLPTDTILLALLMLFIFVSIFLFTAVFGRLWCGWACPQTVYLEFLYRPLERLFEGTAGKGGNPAASRANSFFRKAGFFIAALLVTFIPAHTFLAYFVGVDQLAQWMRASPFQHPTAFLVMAVTTLLMFFDFYWFREQLCLIACPYGRFQSVLLDRFSTIVSYDKRRGEPRGKVSRSIALPIAETQIENQNSKIGNPPAQGDCVDCNLCVATCPTGIDIREGLQMECVNCTQCIDACDTVMEKLHRPRGLIRYSSQAAMEKVPGEKVRRFRFRLVFYPIILAILATVWTFIFIHKGDADVTILRNRGTPYTELASGSVANPLRLKITNRTDAAVTYQFALEDFPGARIDTADNPLTVNAGESKTIPFIIEAPASAFHGGQKEAALVISDGHKFSTRVTVRLLGPFSLTMPAPTPASQPTPQGASP